MKIKKVWITEKIRGENLDWKFPEKPEFEYDDEGLYEPTGSKIARKQYQESIQLAKDHSIEFYNEDKIREILVWEYKIEVVAMFTLKPGIYSVDLEVERVWQRRLNNGDWTETKKEVHDLYQRNNLPLSRTVYRLIERKEERKQALIDMMKEDEKNGMYSHVPTNVKCPFDSCGYEGPDNEFHLSYKGPDTIRICPKCGNSSVIATITTASGEINISPSESQDLVALFNNSDVVHIYGGVWRRLPEQSESQEELWTEVQKTIDITTPGKQYITLLDKFTITRK